MLPSPRTLLALAALTSALTLPGAARSASSRGVSMEILVDGRPLAELRGGSNTYVEAQKNRNYTIRLRNDTGGRVAVALAVDGLNSIDAKHTAARDAAKWVLAPYETAEIQGWQVDDGRARKFLFTSEEKSYGTWIGDSRNLGVISAVFFAEQEREVCCRDPYPRPWFGRGGGLDDGDRVAEMEEAPRRNSSGKAGEARAPSSAPSVGASADSAGVASESRRRDSVATPAPSKKKDERAATGMGSRTRHEVQWTQFELAPEPIAAFDTRYAYRDELLALGIDPDWSPVTPDIVRREQAAGFAPDPGTSCCR